MTAVRRARLRAAGAAWPALVFYAGAGLAAHAGEWTAAWLFFFSGSVLAVTLYRVRYIRARAVAAQADIIEGARC